MRNFQDTFQTGKRSFIRSISIYMTVPLNECNGKPKKLWKVFRFT